MTKKPAILIIDDNMSFTDRMTGLLEESGHTGCISVAADFKEGYRLFLEQRPEMVLLDINLPDKNGIELLKVIRQSKGNCEVIMITNHTGRNYRQQCRELGVRYFLDKTNDFSLVTEIIAGTVC